MKAIHTLILSMLFTHSLTLCLGTRPDTWLDKNAHPNEHAAEIAQRFPSLLSTKQDVRTITEKAIADLKTAPPAQIYFEDVDKKYPITSVIVYLDYAKRTINSEVINYVNNNSSSDVTEMHNALKTCQYALDISSNIRKTHELLSKSPAALQENAQKIQTAQLAEEIFMRNWEKRISIQKMLCAAQQLNQ